MKPLTRWSHSRLRTFSECRRRWWHNYIDESSERPVKIFVDGSEFHNAVREYGAHCWERKVNEDHDQVPIIAADITDPDNQEDFHWWTKRQVWDWEGYYGTSSFELELTADLPNGKGTFIGRLDHLRLVDAWQSSGKLAIYTDWKGRPEEKKPKRHPIKQLQQMAWLICSDIEEVTEVSLQLEFCRTGEVWPGLYRSDVEWDWGRKQALRVGKSIVSDIERVEANLAEGLEKEHWPPCPGEWCSTACSYMHLCPAVELREELMAAETGEVTSIAQLDSPRLRELVCLHRAQGNMGEDELRARRDGKRDGHGGPITATDGTVGDRYPKADTIQVKDWNKLIPKLQAGKVDLNTIIGGLKRGAGKKLAEDPTNRYGDHLKTKAGGSEWKWKAPAESEEANGDGD
jgi:hypothetical protein